jgi:hypothetical protein
VKPIVSSDIREAKETLIKSLKRSFEVYGRRSYQGFNLYSLGL